MAARIIRFEDRDGVIVATDEAGNRFSCSAGRFDWQPLADPPLVERASEPRRSLAGRLEQRSANRRLGGILPAPGRRPSR